MNMSDFKCTCPHCGQHIQGDGQWRGCELRCPACQETMVVPKVMHVPAVVPNPAKPPEDEPARPLELPAWGRIVWLVVLGALTPVIVCVAMAVTFLLGPLAWIAAPIFGAWVSFGLARHCHDQPKPSPYWVYIVSVLVTYALILLASFLPAQHSSGRSEPSLAGAQAAMMGGFVLLFILASALIWLIGAAIAFRGPGARERSFP